MLRAGSFGFEVPGVGVQDVGFWGFRMEFRVWV